MTSPLSAQDALTSAGCPHLGTIDDAGGRGPALAGPDPSGRCYAFGDAAALSLDQQRLVCLTDRHPSCRRFVLSSTGSAPASGIPERPLLSRPAIVASLVVLVIAFAVAVGYLLGGGELVIGVLPGQ